MVASSIAEPFSVAPMIICDRSTCCPLPVALRFRSAVRAHMAPYMPPVSSR